MPNKKFQVPVNLVNLASDPGTASEGDIYYNTTSDTVKVYANGSWVSIGSASTSSVYLVRNNTGSTILKGTLVFASGAEPSGRIDVEPFAAVGGINSELTVMGMAIANISSGVNGEVMSFGTLTGLDTRGDTISAIAVGDETWAEGDILFAHPTVAGKLTKVRPQHDLAVAFITVRHASTGQIAVRIVPGNNHLEWMHDVTIDTPADNEVLAYDTTSSLWINQTASEAGLAALSGATFTGAISGTSLTLSGDLTVNGTTTTINSTTLTVDDKNIELASIASPTNITADGGGITLKGDTDKTFNWLNATSSWTSSEHISIASGKNLLLNGSTSGTITLTPAATSGTNTITLPAATGTVALTSILKYQADEPTSPSVGDIWIESDVDVPTDTYATLTGIQTLTNKTLTSPILNGGTINGGGSLTVDSTELNFVDGVTSNIQTQLNDKVNISNPTFQGTVSLGQSATFFIEGSTNDSFETTLTVADPTADRTITLPNATGTVALLDSPAFTGTPTAPTASVGTNTTQVATTAFVQANSDRLVAERITATGAIANTQTQIVSFTAPANSIAQGDTFRFTGYANASGATTASPILRIRIGTTTLTGAIVSELTGTSTGTTLPFRFEAIVTCRTTGSSGTVGGSSSVLYSTGIATQSITAPVTVNTTVSNIVEATFQSGGTRTYTFEYAILEKLAS